MPGHVDIDKVDFSRRVNDGVMMRTMNEDGMAHYGTQILMRSDLHELQPAKGDNGKKDKRAKAPRTGLSRGEMIVSPIHKASRIAEVRRKGSNRVLGHVRYDQNQRVWFYKRIDWRTYSPQAWGSKQAAVKALGAWCW